MSLYINKRLKIKNLLLPYSDATIYRKDIMEALVKSIRQHELLQKLSVILFEGRCFLQDGVNRYFAYRIAFPERTMIDCSVGRMPADAKYKHPSVAIAEWRAMQSRQYPDNCNMTPLETLRFLYLNGVL